MKKLIFVLLLLLPVNVYAQWELPAGIDSTKIDDDSISGDKMVNPLRMPTYDVYMKSARVDSLLSQNGINVKGLIVQHDGTIPAWGHGPTGLAVKGSVEFDGNIYSDNALFITDNTNIIYGTGSNVFTGWDYNGTGDDLLVTRLVKESANHTGAWWIARDLNPENMTDHDDYLSPTLVHVNDEGADANDYSGMVQGWRTTADVAVTNYYDFYAMTGSADGSVDGTTTELGPIFRFGASGSTTVTGFDGGDAVFEGDVSIGDSLFVAGNHIFAPDFAGILVDDGGSTTITTVQIFEQMTTFDTDMPEAISNGAHGTDDIVIGATGNYYVYFAANATSAANNKEYSFNAFQITAATTVVAFVTTGTPSVISSEGHGYSNGQRVKIKDVGGATGVNNRIYTVAGVDAGDSTYTLDAEDGTDVNGTGFGVWDSDGTAQLATKLAGVHRTRKFGTGSDNGAFSAASYEALTLNNTLELWVLGITDATNITVKDYTFGMERKN